MNWVNQIKRLNDYLTVTPTTKKWFDGRYFNQVLANYPGLVKKPLYITINSSGATVEMDRCLITTDYPGFLRVIIKTPEATHAHLAILDYHQSIVYLFRPFHSPMDSLLAEMISQYLQMPVQLLAEKAPVGQSVVDQSPFGHAYLLKYACDCLQDKPIDLRHIRKFAHRVEQEYQHTLADGIPEETNGFLEDWGPTLLGAGTGALIGGAAGGGTGALIGAAGGGLLGYSISKGGLFG